MSLNEIIKEALVLLNNGLMVDKNSWSFLFII